MGAGKIEKAGISFAVSRQAPVVLEVRPHHDTIAALKGVQVAFEFLNGITAEQAKKIVELLNENVVGVIVTTSDEKTKATSV